MRWIAMLAVLTATSALNAFAQDVTTSGTKPTGTGGAAAPIKAGIVGGAASDSTRWVIPINTTGTGVQTNEINKDRDNTLSRVLLSGVLVRGNADSVLTPIDVHQYKTLKLVFFITPVDTLAMNQTSTVGDSARFRVFYQLREHISGQTDTASVAAEYPNMMMAGNNPTTFAAGNDSILVGNSRIGTNQTPWPEEHVLLINAQRINGAGGASKGAFPSAVSRVIQVPGGPEQFYWLSIRMRFVSETDDRSTARIKYTVWLLGWS